LVVCALFALFGLAAATGTAGACALTSTYVSRVSSTLTCTVTPTAQAVTSVVYTAPTGFQFYGCSASSLTGALGATTLGAGSAYANTSTTATWTIASTTGTAAAAALTVTGCVSTPSSASATPQFTIAPGTDSMTETAITAITANPNTDSIVWNTTAASTFATVTMTFTASVATAATNNFKLILPALWSTNAGTAAAATLQTAVVATGSGAATGTGAITASILTPSVVLTGITGAATTKYVVIFNNVKTPTAGTYNIMYGTDVPEYTSTTVTIGSASSVACTFLAVVCAAIALLL